MRALSFDDSHELRDPDYTGKELDIYASRLRQRFEDAIAQAAQGADPATAPGTPVTAGATDISPAEEPVDVYARYRAMAIQGLRQSKEFWDKLNSSTGIRWSRVQGLLAKNGPGKDIVGNQMDWAYPSVAPALNELVGPQDVAWKGDRRPGTGGKTRPLDNADRRRPRARRGTGSRTEL